MIVVTARGRLQPEYRDAFAAEAKALVPLVQQEPGCLAYNAHFSATEPDVIMFVEEWEDEAALQQHFQQPHLVAFLGRVSPWFAEGVTLSTYAVSGVNRQQL